MSTQPPNIPEVNPQERSELMEVYKITFDTWRSQVDSYWQRSNYFALFETAAVGGCWHLVSGEHALEVLLGVGFAILGIALTVVWHRNNAKTHIYVRHWWDALTTIEGRLNLRPNDFAAQLEQEQEERHKNGDIWYRHLIQWVPCLFGVAWVALFLVAVARALYFACH